MSVEQDSQVLGYAFRQLPAEDKRIAPYRRALTPAMSDTERFGDPYPDPIMQLHDKLLLEGRSFTEKERGEALNALVIRADLSKKGDWKPVDLSPNSKSREMYARALAGLWDIGLAIEEGGMSLVSSPAEMGYWDRKRYYNRLSNEMLEAMGLEGRSYDSEDCLRVLGDMFAIDRSELGNLERLIHESPDVFEGKFTDEALEFVFAFGGGREGGTYTSTMAFSDIGLMSLKTFQEEMVKVNPDQLFFLINMPMKFIDYEGIERTITIREVADWLMTDQGRDYFGKTLYEKAKSGVSPYADKLREFFPEADKGLSIGSNFKVLHPKTGEKMRAGVLDRGKRSLLDPSTFETYLRMATNPTFLEILLTSRGVVNMIAPRNRIYRKGDVFKLGKDLQKGANERTFYEQMYNDFDGWLRQRIFPRLRSFGEYLGDNADMWAFFKPRTSKNPRRAIIDYADPFHPRGLDVRSGGLVEYEGTLDAATRIQDQIEITTMFFNVEDDPASNDLEFSVQELVAAASGYYYDRYGNKHDTTPLSEEDQVAMAWRLRENINKPLFQFTNLEDRNLETLNRYRTFYPVPPEVIIKRLQNVPRLKAERFARYGFDKIALRYVKSVGGDGRGVEGMKMLAKALGSGLFTMPRWGDADLSKVDKHGDYEERHKQLNQYLIDMEVGGTQSKEGEVEEDMAESIAYGHQDLPEKTKQIIDKFVMGMRGVQGIPSLRKGAWEQYAKAYVEGIALSAYLGGARGAWWFYRVGCVMGKYMAGLATSPLYLAKDMTKINGKGEKIYRAVMPGVPLAEYADLYNLESVSEEALAVLGIYFNKAQRVEDDGSVVWRRVDMVYTGRASDFHPIAMDRVDGKVVIDPGRVNVAREYDSKRILPKSQQVSVRQIRKHNFEVVKDFNLDPDSAYIYYDYDENYDSEA